jgi:hypothetical protein
LDGAGLLDDLINNGVGLAAAQNQLRASTPERVTERLKGAVKPPTQGACCQSAQ